MVLTRSMSSAGASASDVSDTAGTGHDDATSTLRRTKKAASKQEKTPTLTRRTSTRLRGAQAPATRPLEAVPEDEAASEGDAEPRAAGGRTPRAARPGTARGRAKGAAIEEAPVKELDKSAADSAEDAPGPSGAGDGDDDNVDNSGSDWDESDEEALGALATSMAGILGGNGQPGEVLRLGGKGGGGGGMEDEGLLRWEPELGGAEDRGALKRASAAREALVARGAGGKERGLSKRAVLGSRDGRAERRQAKRDAPETLGSKWFDLPAPRMTPELKTDLRVLKLRGTFDAKRFYKSHDDTKLPKFFQMGTVVEGSAEFHSARMAKKERKRTLAEEILHDPSIAQYRKKKYARLQADASKWSLKPKKGKGKGKGMPRDTAKPRRPKH